MSRLQAQKVTIPLDNICVDEYNPRLPPQKSQLLAIRAMVEQQGEKIVHLAADIAEYGLSEAERFMALESKREGYRYISLDGNRRLVALNLLHSPMLADGVLPARWLNRLKKLAEEFAKNPITEVELAVFATREQGALWVARRHAAGLNGVGQDAWEAIDKHRFDAWRGIESREWQVLQFVYDHGNLAPTDAQRLHKLPISTLLRLLSDSYVKEQLGLEYRNNRVVTTLPNEEVIKPLRRILLDLLDKKVDVTMLNAKPDRKRYIDNLAPEDRPCPHAVTSPHFHRLGSKQRFAEHTGEVAVSSPSNSSLRPARRPGRERVTIAPANCQLHLLEPQVAAIYRELQLLDARIHPTAGALLLRHFLELSLDYYLTQQPPPITISGTLAEKFAQVTRILVTQGSLSDEEAMRMYEILLASPRLLPTVSQPPSSNEVLPLAKPASDLRSQWNNLQPILCFIWS